MKNLILILFLAIASIGYSQTSPGLSVRGPAKDRTVSEVVKDCDSTGLLFKGEKVWKTKKGKYFVVRFYQVSPYGAYRYYLIYKP